VADDWARWQRERPELRDKAFQRLPWVWLLAALIVLALEVVALLLLGTASWFPWFLTIVVPYFLLIPVFLWLVRWSKIEAFETDRRFDAAMKQARLELDRSEGRAEDIVPASPDEGRLHLPA
jgi:fatty acid desaturase